MSERQATLLVADELLVSVTGKFIVQSVFTSDIVLATDPMLVAQLIFFFLIECDIQNPFQTLAVQVTLPGESPVTSAVPIVRPAPDSIPPGRTRWINRWPIVYSLPTLRPGRIEAKVIHESGEIAVTAPWIVMVGAGSNLPGTGAAMSSA